MNDAEYFAVGKRIWQECVPKSGQSLTVEGELLRSVEKLRDEALRNGNGNWDEGFEILLQFLGGRLLDSKVFSASILKDTNTILAQLAKQNPPLLDDAPFDRLSDRVVDYFLFYGSQSHTRNPKLNR